MPEDARSAEARIAEIRERWDGYDPSLHWNARKGLQMTKDVHFLLDLVQQLSTARDAQQQELKEIHLLLIGMTLTPTKTLAIAVKEVMDAERDLQARLAALARAEQ